MSNNTHAVIVGDGEPPSRDLLYTALQAEDNSQLLCADGGANVAVKLGFLPDCIIGDLDSIHDETKKAVTSDKLINVTEQDTTDLEKVLAYAENAGIQSATLLGFTGRRTDHTLWNLNLLKVFSERIELCFLDDYCEIRRVGSQLVFQADKGQKISLCPLSGDVCSVYTTGLKWPLQKVDLIPGNVCSISNEVLSNPVEIKVGTGELLLCVQRDSASGTIKVVR